MHVVSFSFVNFVMWRGQIYLWTMFSILFGIGSVPKALLGTRESHIKHSLKAGSLICASALMYIVDILGKDLQRTLH